MANKIEIKKFLERKKEESIKKLHDESKQKQDAVKDTFFEAYGWQFEAIRKTVIDAGVVYDNLANRITDSGIATLYSRPACEFNNLIDILSLNDLRNRYVDIVEANKIGNTYDDKIRECRNEYDGLIAVCNANNAKDSLIILENLGFDISEVEVKKEECTTLITNIDASKLFIVKGDK